MKETLLHLDRQIMEALTLGKRFALAKPRGVKKILFSGMGGSAICGDILRLLMNRSGSLSFKVNRSSELPAWVDRETFVVLSSYSGNTAETLQVAKKVISKKIPALVLSSGGKLSRLAAKHRVPHLKFPGGMMPRCAIGMMTFSMLPVLKRWGWVRYSYSDIRETLKDFRNRYLSQAKTLAKKCYGKSVHFYGISGFSAPVLVRWRAQFAENAKTLSSFHLIPEMFHNEIEGWQHPKAIIQKSAAIFFSDRDDLKWLQPKIRGAQASLRKAGASVLEIKSKGRSVLARLFSLMVLGDWVSYELALLNGVDPLAIPVIEAIKKIE